MISDFKKSAGFTIIELLLVMIIVSTVAVVGGGAYLRAARNARVDEAARGVWALIQEARSLAIDNKNVNQAGAVTPKEYFVKLEPNIDPNVPNSSKIILGYENTDGTFVPNYKEYTTKSKITYQFIAATGGTFDANNAIQLTYSLPKGDLAIEDGDGDTESFVSISFSISDALTGRAVRFDMNTVSGLVETGRG